MDVSENSGTPKSSILIGFSIINHPFWGTPIFLETPIHISQGILVTFLEVHDVIGVTQVICSYLFLQQRSRSLGFRFESIRENASKMPRLLIRRCFEMCFQHCF